MVKEDFDKGFKKGFEFLIKWILRRGFKKKSAFSGDCDLM